MKTERLFSGLMTLISLSFIYLAQSYVAPIAYDPIGPRPYPVLIFSLLAISTFFVAIRPTKFTKSIELNFTPYIIRNLALCTVALLCYGAFFEILGFPVATGLMTMAIGLLFGGDFIKTLFTSFVLGVSLYILFANVLEVKLPLGFLSELIYQGL